ncbi:MAG TPA: hypothetical protein VFP63_06535, partial [Dehalococcoidia bacterium]|nr:hypothetical protein [Dehalococcoidia bacterium]
GIPDSTNRANVLDMTSFLAPLRRLGASPGDAAYNQRWDLAPGRGLFAVWISVTDITAIAVGPSGYPPITGGKRALFGPACPWPP